MWCLEFLHVASKRHGSAPGIHLMCTPPQAQTHTEGSLLRVNILDTACRRFKHDRCSLRGPSWFVKIYKRYVCVMQIKVHQTNIHKKEVHLMLSKLVSYT